MLRLMLFSLSAAILVGYLTGGRLGNLAETRFRWAWLGLVGIALQFLPVTGTIGNVVLMLSFVCLFVVAGVNWRLPGFLLVLIGLWMNFLVITVNEGMPVTREAVIASGQADTMQELRALDSPKHHLQYEDDQLVFLSDILGLGPPVRQAVSIGDLAAVAGLMWFVVAAMQHGRKAEVAIPFARRRRPAEGTAARRVVEATET